jgi:hypothetical protein
MHRFQPIAFKINADSLIGHFPESPKLHYYMRTIAGDGGRINYSCRVVFVLGVAKGAFLDKHDYMVVFAERGCSPLIQVWARLPAVLPQRVTSMLKAPPFLLEALNPHWDGSCRDVHARHGAAACCIILVQCCHLLVLALQEALKPSKHTTVARNGQGVARGTEIDTGAACLFSGRRKNGWARRPSFQQASHVRHRRPLVSSAIERPSQPSATGFSPVPNIALRL